MSKIFLVYLLLLLNSFFVFSKDNASIQDISNQLLEEYEALFREETDPDQKAFYEIVVRPERFDINKDRKISRSEIKSALLYVLFSKNEADRKNTSKEVIRLVHSNVDLFIKNLNSDTFTYKQFGYLMKDISAKDFVNVEMLENSAEDRKNNLESAKEL